MTYAFLLYPHANIRYRQSLLKLAVQELSMTLAALGRAGSCRRKWAAQCSSRLKRTS